MAVRAQDMQKDIRRELNKVDDGTAKTVGRKVGKDLSAGVGEGSEGAANEVKARLSERLGTQVGTVVGKGIGAGIKLGIAGAASAAALAVGGVSIALKKGFDRLEAIDTAKFKLQALGNDAATTAKIMDNALASVKGTAFGLQDAATAAASAVAAGIKPGEDLTKYLKEVGDAAAVAGTNFDDMGSIFGKIQTSNKAYTDDLNQLADRGLPIFKWLQDEYGVTADKLSDMVQKGQVDSAHFQDAINKNIGGAAQKMGQSFDGAVDNMEASVARLGANFITALLGGDPNGDTLAGPTQAITNLTTKFDEISQWVNTHKDQIHGFFEDVKTVAGQAATAVKDISTWLVNNKGAAETLAEVFVAWKVLGVVSSVASGIRGIATALGLVGPAAAAAGATGAAGLAPLAAALGPITVALAGITGGKALSDALVNTNKDHYFNPDGSLRGSGDQWIVDNLGPIGRFLEPSGARPTPPKPPPASTHYGPRDSPLNPKSNFYGPRATGGSILGPGGPTSDLIPIMASNGEHMWSAADVNAVGGQGAMYRIRAMARAGMFKFAQGGAITIDALKTFASGISGHGYVFGGGNGDTFNTDCSGAQSTIANFISGGNGRFATGTEGTALLSRGFQAGDPPPGISAYWVGWKNGGPGGGHTAGTIVDPKGGNVNVEMGGASGGGAYGGSAGASSFPNRAWIAVAGGDDPSKSNFGGPSGGAPSGGGTLGTSFSGGGGADASSLAQTLIGGLAQSTGLDGSVFSDPTQWPNVKSGIALLNFFTGLGGGDDMMNIGGVNIPGLGGLLKPNGLGSTTPNDPSVHQGTGAAPGPAFVNNGTIGMDPRQLTQRVDAHQNQAWRKSGMNAVRPQ